MKGWMGKGIIYLLFAIVVYMGVTSFTNKSLPPESSTMVGAFFGLITFLGCVILGWLTGRKRKEK